MIYKKNKLFCSIKTGKVKINSIAKSIKSIMLKEKSLFVLFNLNSTPSISHIIFCINSIPEKFTAIDFLIKLTGEKQLSLIRKKTELNKTKNACLIVFESNKIKAKKISEKISKEIGLKENKEISSEKRLKELIKKEKLNKKILNGFGEDFYSSVNNFFIEKSAVVK